MTSSNEGEQNPGRLTVGQTARLLGISRWTVRRMVLADELEAIDVRGMLRVDPDSVTRYIAEHQHRKSSDEKE